MADKAIRGITIEINGDVTKLDKALSGVDKSLKQTQTNLKDVERLLKIDPKNVELLDQKQRLLAQGVEQTSQKYETLKKTLEESTASNVKYDEWTKAQSSLQGAITKTENALRSLEQEQKQLASLDFAPDSDQMIEVQERIDAAKEKSEALRQQMADTYEQLGRPISIDQYDALQRALVESKHQMEEAKQAANDFENGLGDMSDAADDSAQASSKLGDLLGKAGLSTDALTVAGAIGVAAAAVKEFADFCKDAVIDSAAYADKILTLSTNYGLATDTLQEYLYMSELTDTSLDTITGSIAKLTKSMDKARKGPGDVADAFTKLNIRVTENGGVLRDSEAVFNEVINALGYIREETERDAISMAIFGKSSMELNSLIATGADGIAAYADEAHKMGYVLDRDALETLGRVDDQMRRMDNMMATVKNRIALEMAPEIIDLTERFLDLAESADWEAIGRSAATVIRTATPLLITLAESIAGLTLGLGKLFEAAEKAANAIAGLFGKSTATNPGRRGGFGSSFSAPGFASGGVFEPNSPMLAVLGDNRTEREIAAPRSELIDAYGEAMQRYGSRGDALPPLRVGVTFTGSNAQVGRALAPVITAEWDRQGPGIN